MKELPKAEEVLCMFKENRNGYEQAMKEYARRVLDYVLYEWNFNKVDMMRNGGKFKSIDEIVLKVKSELK